MKLGVITGVKLSKGLAIEFRTLEKINADTYVQIEYEGVKKVFKVSEVEVSGGLLIGRAKESGYWAKKLSKNSELDIRSLIDLGVEKVVDEDEIKSIKESSQYC
jgi:hypothetical protein